MPIYHLKKIVMKTNSKKVLDLNKVKTAVFNNIELLLNDLDIKCENFGSNYFSTCPIHEGSDNNRALSICKDKMHWRCWTRNCHEQYGKNICGLVKGILSKRKHKDVEFSEVLRYICNLYHFDKKEIQKVKEEAVKENDFKEIVDIFTPKTYNKISKPIQPIDISDSCSYFEHRGFLKETLKHFGVGDCISDCKLKNRAVIPVHDAEGEIVGYIGRATKPYITPKFIFSKGLVKTNYLYNYHRAIESVMKTSCLFIAEGQGDVWRLYEAGVKNCVSIFGKEISEAQKHQILNLNITTLVILTDDDQAGRESKFHMQRQFSRMFSLKFPILTKKDIGDMSVEKVKKEILPYVKGLY